MAKYQISAEKIPQKYNGKHYVSTTVNSSCLLQSLLDELASAAKYF
jgi:hypothetical protein